MKKKAEYYEKLGNGSVKCLLCFRNCVIAPGKNGFCGIRGNIDGDLFSLGYAETVSVSLDPIEKKPLYHFKPGSRILSTAPNGCNLDCPFCQNHSISQSLSPTVTLTPEEAGILSRQKGSIGISYTYTEPFVWFEYLMDAGREVRKNGGYNVLVSNGVINPEPLARVTPLIDAANIDLKCFSAEKYRKILGGDLESVLRTIRYLKKNSVHVEVTTLVVTGFNDSAEEIRNAAKFISSVDDEIPYHLSRYFPNYKYNAPPTDEKKLTAFYEEAKKYLKFVFLGNLYDPEKANTYCPDCGNLWIDRSSFRVTIPGIEEGKCSKCKRVTGFIS